MKVILNSDILYSTQLMRDKLPRALESLLSECSHHNIEVVIPETTLLEFNNKQSNAVRESIKRIESAYSTMSSYHIHYSRVDPSELIKDPDLLKLVRACGTSVVLERPTFQDFQEAHKRACLHQSPHPEESKSDEMRDLVIWMIALRIADQHNDSLLVSRDNLHVNERGDAEAAKHRLIRVKSIEAALDYLGAETPSARLIKEFIQPIWEDLIKAGLPLAEKMLIVRVSHERFIQGEGNPSFVFGVFRSKTISGQLLEAEITIHAERGVIVDATLRNISIDGKPWQQPEVFVSPHKRLLVQPTDLGGRISELRKILPEKT